MKVDIDADLQAIDEDGLLWAYADEARDASLLQPGALLMAGDERARAVIEVVELVHEASGVIVRMRRLPGAPEDYAEVLRRAELVA